MIDAKAHRQYGNLHGVFVQPAGGVGAGIAFLATTIFIAFLLSSLSPLEERLIPSLSRQVALNR